MRVYFSPMKLEVDLKGKPVNSDPGVFFMGLSPIPLTNVLSLDTTPRRLLMLSLRMLSGNIAGHSNRYLLRVCSTGSLMTRTVLMQCIPIPPEV